MILQAVLQEARTFVSEQRAILANAARQPRLAAFDRSIASCSVLSIPGVTRPNSSASLTPLISSSASGVVSRSLSSITIVNRYVNSIRPRPACGVCGNVADSLMPPNYAQASTRVSYDLNTIYRGGLAL